MTVKEVWDYIQCYYQAFGLGMVTILLIQHVKEKYNGKSQRHHRRSNNL